MASALTLSVVRPAVRPAAPPAALACPPPSDPDPTRKCLAAPQAPRTAAFAAAQQQRRPRRLQPVRAQADDEQKGLDFTSNKRAVRLCIIAVDKLQ